MGTLPPFALLVLAQLIGISAGDITSAVGGAPVLNNNNNNNNNVHQECSNKCSQFVLFTKQTELGEISRYSLAKDWSTGR
jgi:hypothetical protein